MDLLPPQSTAAPTLVAKRSSTSTDGIKSTAGTPVPLRVEEESPLSDRRASQRSSPQSRSLSSLPAQVIFMLCFKLGNGPHRLNLSTKAYMRPKAPFLSWEQTEIQLAQEFGVQPCRLRQGETEVPIQKVNSGSLSNYPRTRLPSGS